MRSNANSEAWACSAGPGGGIAAPATAPYPRNLLVAVCEDSITARNLAANTTLVRVLLTATAGQRLEGRELRSELEKETERSAYKARLLDEHASADIARIVSNGRSVVDTASHVITTTGWISPVPYEKSVAQGQRLPPL